MVVNLSSVDTDIDFDAAVLQTADLAAARAALENRRVHGDICLYCERAIVERKRSANYPATYEHLHDRSGSCELDEQVTPYEDPLDEDEQGTLALLNDLDRRLDGGLATERSLISDEHFQDQVREEAEDEVPEFIRPYVEWERYADALLSDHTTVTMSAGTYERTYHYR